MLSEGVRYGKFYDQKMCISIMVCYQWIRYLIIHSYNREIEIDIRFTKLLEEFAILLV